MGDMARLTLRADSTALATCPGLGVVSVSLKNEDRTLMDAHSDCH